MQRVRERSRAEKRLRAKEVPVLGAGTHEDGGGLRLVVEPLRDNRTPGARRWVVRVTIAGKRHNRGLGPYPLISLDVRRRRTFDAPHARAATCSPSGNRRVPGV
jgi:hypothetical protein